MKKKADKGYIRFETDNNTYDIPEEYFFKYFGFKLINCIETIIRALIIYLIGYLIPVIIITVIVVWLLYD